MLKSLALFITHLKALKVQDVQDQIFFNLTSSQNVVLWYFAIFQELLPLDTLYDILLVSS